MTQKVREPAAANGESSKKVPTSVKRGEAKDKTNGGGSQAPLVYRPKAKNAPFKYAVRKGKSRVTSEELKPLTAQARACGKDIAAAWNKAVSSIIETGRLLIKAKQEHPGEFLAIVDQYLPFGPRTAQRLMKIAEHPVLSNATHASHLPASWMTLDVLQHIPQDQMLMMFEDGTLHAEIERSQAQELVNRINKDGIYFFRDFQNALNSLTVIQRKWTDTKALAVKLSQVKSCEGEETIWLKWQDCLDIGSWLAEFHDACQKVERDVAVKQERERARDKREEAAQAKRRKEIIAKSRKILPNNPLRHGAKRA